MAPQYGDFFDYDAGFQNLGGLFDAFNNFNNAVNNVNNPQIPIGIDNSRLDDNRRRYYKFKGTEECSICLEKISSYHLYVTKCNHTFHENCIKEAYKVNKNCPLCRSNISNNRIQSNIQHIQLYIQSNIQQFFNQSAVEILLSCQRIFTILIMLFMMFILIYSSIYDVKVMKDGFTKNQVIHTFPNVYFDILANLTITH